MSRGLGDVYKRQSIADFLGVNFEEDNPITNVQYDNLKEWTNWLFNKDLPNKIIGDSDNITNLSRVISHPMALERFREGEKILTALEYTDELDVQFQTAIETALKQMEKADLLTAKIKNFYKGLLEDLTEINHRIRKIRSAKELKDDEF